MMRAAVILAGLVAGVIALTLAEGLLRLLDVAPTSPRRYPCSSPHVEAMARLFTVPLRLAF